MGEVSSFRRVVRPRFLEYQFRHFLPKFPLRGLFFDILEEIITTRYDIMLYYSILLQLNIVLNILFKLNNLN